MIFMSLYNYNKNFTYISTYMFIFDIIKFVFAILLSKTKQIN